MITKIKEYIWVQLFIIYTRYLLGGAFVFASIVKMQGVRFTTNSGELEPINSAWHFFETLYASGIYWKFIGVGQFLAGLLLMTQRYAKLGALMFFPIILNIFFITISYYFAYTPVITSLMLLANILLLLWHWNELKILFNLKYEPEEFFSIEQDKFWQLIGVLLFAILFVYKLFVIAPNFFPWLISLFVVSFIGLLLGLKRAKRKKKRSSLDSQALPLSRK